MWEVWLVKACWSEHHGHWSDRDIISIRRQQFVCSLYWWWHDTGNLQTIFHNRPSCSCTCMVTWSGAQGIGARGRDADDCLQSAEELADDGMLLCPRPILWNIIPNSSQGVFCFVHLVLPLDGRTLWLLEYKIGFLKTERYFEWMEIGKTYWHENYLCFSDEGKAGFEMNL